RPVADEQLMTELVRRTANRQLERVVAEAAQGRSRLDSDGEVLDLERRRVRADERRCWTVGALAHCAGLAPQFPVAHCREADRQRRLHAAFEPVVAEVP